MKNLFNKLNNILSRKQKKQCMILLLLTVAGSILELFSVSALLPLVTLLLDSEHVMQNKYVIYFCKLFSINNLSILIISFCVALIFLFIVKNMFLIAILKKRMYTVNDIRFSLTKRVLDSYMQRDYSFHTLTNSSVLLRGMDEDVSGLANCLNQIFVTILEGLTIILIVTGLLIISPIPTILLFIFIGTIGYTYIRRQKRIIQSAGEVYSYNAAVAKKHALQAFGGIKEILVTRTMVYFADQCSESMKKRIHSESERGISEKAPTYMFELIFMMAFLLMLISVSFLGESTMSISGQLSAFGVAALRLLPSVGRLNTAWSSLLFYKVSVDNVYATLQDVEKNQNVVKAVEKYSTICFKNTIVIDGVWWKYEGRDEYILQGIYLEIQRGEAIAIIGPSGSGKTTLADILLGLYMPQKGKITVDGVDINWHNPAWAIFIGYVPQTAYLLDDTIRSNIAFGINRNEIDDAYIWDILSKVQLDDFVKELPHQLDTVIGENGVRISGGQRQRISIARALYRDPQVMIFDEATSALDSETESAIMESIDALRGHKTLIIIAHRLTTIQRCDHIYEVTDGRIKKVEHLSI